MFSEDTKNRFVKRYLSCYINAANVKAVARELDIPKEKVQEFCKELGFKFSSRMILPEVYDNLIDDRLLRRFYRLAKNESERLRKELNSLKSKLRHRDKRVEDVKLQLDGILKRCAETEVIKNCEECISGLDALPMPWYLKVFGGEQYLTRIKNYIKSEIYVK